MKLEKIIRYFSIFGGDQSPASVHASRLEADSESALRSTL